MTARSASERGLIADSTPEPMPITSHSAAAPSASETVTPTRCPISVVTGVEL